MRKAILITLVMVVAVSGALLAGSAYETRASARERRAVVEQEFADQRAQMVPPLARLPVERARVGVPVAARVPGRPPELQEGELPVILQQTFDEWASRHRLSAEKRREVHVAIRDASANREAASRAVLRGATTLPNPDPEAAWEEFAKLNLGEYAAPELFAAVERIAGKPAAADFAEEFGDILPLLLYVP